MKESKGVGAVGYKFSAGIIKQAAKKCYKLDWNPDPSNAKIRSGAALNANNKLPTNPPSVS